MQRLHSLDFLRAVAMLLGLAIHAPLIFYEPDIAIESGLEPLPEPEVWIWTMLTFISNWRMPLFYLLAGFFAAMVIEKRGVQKFLWDRSVRIGLACVFFASAIDLMDGKLNFTLAHLWFLYYLFFFILMLCFLQQFQIVRNALTRSLSTKAFFILAGWLLITVPLAAVFNNDLSPLTMLEPPETYAEIKLGNLLYYFSYFLMGPLLYSNQKLFPILAQTKSLVALAIFSLAAFAYQLLGFAESWVTYAFLKGLNSLFWCLLFLGLATRFIRSGSPLLNWLVELSYPIYLLHIIPIVIISMGFYQTGFSQVNVVIFSIFFGFLASVFLYYLLIKFTPLNWMVNGYAKSFLRFKARQQRKAS